MTVKQLLEQMDAQELTEWWAFFVLQKRVSDKPDNVADQIKQAFQNLPANKA